MKVIDLLNKIANGEKVPKKIKCYDKIFTLYEDNKDGLQYVDETKEPYDIFGYLLGCVMDFNEEVEAMEEDKIEEDKKIEKLYELNNESDESKRLREKINEIIDKISKGE